MDTPLAGEQALPIGERGIGKQTSTDRLGRDVQEGGLQSSLRFSGAKQTFYTNCKAISVMMIFAAATGTPRSIARAL